MVLLQFKLGLSYANWLGALARFQRNRPQILPTSSQLVNSSRRTLQSRRMVAQLRSCAELCSCAAVGGGKGRDSRIDRF